MPELDESSAMPSPSSVSAVAAAFEFASPSDDEAEGSGFNDSCGPPESAPDLSGVDSANMDNCGEVLVGVSAAAAADF